MLEHAHASKLVLDTCSLSSSKVSLAWHTHVKAYSFYWASCLARVKWLNEVTASGGYSVFILLSIFAGYCCTALSPQTVRITLQLPRVFYGSLLCAMEILKYIYIYPKMVELHTSASDLFVVLLYSYAPLSWLILLCSPQTVGISHFRYPRSSLRVCMCFGNISFR